MPLTMIVKVYKTPTAETMGLKWVRLETLNEMRKIGTKVKKDLEGAFKDFSSPRPIVSTKIHLSLSAPTATIDVIADDPQGRLEFLEKGTRGHVVTARKASVMAWKGNFRSKSTPRSLKSRPGGQSGPKRFSKQHYVRGIKAREYGETLAKKWRKPYHKMLMAAAARGAAKAG